MHDDKPNESFRSRVTPKAVNTLTTVACSPLVCAEQATMLAS